MDPDTSLNASFWTMTIMTTIGSVDMPGRGQRKMPSPRNYVASIVVWSVLQLVSDRGYGRGASTAAWVMVLVGMVLGPFGTKVVNFINSVADLAAQPGGVSPQ